MENKKEKKEKQNLEDKLDDFLNEKKEKECVGEECFINDGKEIVE